MTESQETRDEWAPIFEEMEPSEREEKLASIFRTLLDDEESERRERLKALASREYELPDEKLRPFTISRLKAFLALDPPGGSQIALSYDAMMRDMPASIAMRRVATVQKVVANFPPEDEDRLRALIPNVFAGAPGHAGVSAPTVTRTPELSAMKKPFWAIWRKG